MINSPTTTPPNPAHRWLFLASWIVVALAYLIFFVLDLRLDYAQLLLPCEGADCNYLAISQAEIDVLESWGLSSETYALILNSATVLGVAACWLLGGLIIWRQGNTRIGWAVSLTLVVIPITMISDVDNVVAHYPNLLIPSTILSTVGTFVMLGFLYLFPSGRFYPRWAYVPVIITFLVFELFSAGFNRFINLPVIKEFGPLILVGLLLLAGAFQILRYQHESTQVERQQTKWILLGMFLLIINFPIWFLAFGEVVAIPSGQPRLLASMAGWLTNMLFTISLPLTMAIAIMRYRLWDIDLVVRRTLQYGLLTGLLALTYFSGIVILQTILGPLTGSGNSPIVIVLTTLGIAILFNPLRRRVQDFIDRRFYRRKYDAEKALHGFATIARDEVDVDRLSIALLGVIEETTQPEHISLWIKQ